MKEKQLKFEDALSELENIIDDLESGELTLDESLERYERGIKALTVCRKILGTAEQKIQLLIRAAGDELKSQPFQAEAVLESEDDEDDETDDVPF